MQSHALHCKHVLSLFLFVRVHATAGWRSLGHKSHGFQGAGEDVIPRSKRGPQGWRDESPSRSMARGIRGGNILLSGFQPQDHQPTQVRTSPICLGMKIICIRILYMRALCNTAYTRHTLVITAILGYERRLYSL